MLYLHVKTLNANSIIISPLTVAPSIQKRRLPAISTPQNGSDAQGALNLLNQVNPIGLIQPIGKLACVMLQ